MKDPSAVPPLQAETGLFLLSVIQSRPDPSGMEAIRMEVRQELERSSHLDREQWLKVSRHAPREELVRAIDEKIDRYHSLLDTVQGDEQLRTDIELILGRAASMLRLARQNPSQPVTTAPVPSVAPSASSPVSPTSSVAPVAPQASTAASQPLVQPGEAPVVAAESGPSQMEVEHLLMEAEVRLTVSDYANAVRVLMKLVDIVPNQPALHARLAVAMACYPRTAKQAEREFLEAIRLDPRNADYHYQFGLYYKTMRQRARAVVEMRAALGINPRHSGARTELEQLSPKDPLLNRLKKMLK